MVGIVDPRDDFSAAEYAALARPLIDTNLAENGWALVVGGTGLYMRAALAPLAVGPEADLALRHRLEARVAAEGPGALHAELAHLDSAAADAIDPRNVRRVVRALEAVMVTGTPWSGRSDLWQPRYFHPTLVVGLTLDRAELYRRIDIRAARIVLEGAVDEVRRFREEESSAANGARTGISSAIGYQEICRYVDGLQTLDETINQVAAATRHYARRQLTWLRKLTDAVIIDIHDRSPGAVADDILALAMSGEHTKEPYHP
jgi:tRNA dimethylallyltransferase